jgi:hypothetical protein
LDVEEHPVGGGEQDVEALARRLVGHGLGQVALDDAKRMPSLSTPLRA